MAKIRIDEESFPVAQNPPSGKFFVGIDTNTGHLTTQDSSGTTVDYAPSGGGAWGSITGTLSDQTDLQAALDAKLTSGAQGADLNMNSHKITAVTDPASAQDAATKNYVDTKGMKLCVVVDSKSNGTNGGTSTAGSWVKRDLTSLTDSNTGITLNTSQLSIPAGTYAIWTSSPFHGIVNRANTRLYNVTDSSLILNGSSACSTGGGTTFYSFITGIFSLAATKTVELQYQVQTAAGAGQDLGFSSGGIFTVGNEIYTQIILLKIA